VQHEAEFEELFRVGSDYGELLKRGHVIREVDDPEEWRAMIRREARRDKVRVLTRRGPGNHVAAYLNREASIDQVREAFELISFREQAEAAALELGHVLEWAHADTRFAARCGRCGARLYGEYRAMHEDSILEGEAMVDICSLVV
jgi:hypothetical protein